MSEHSTHHGPVLKELSSLLDRMEQLPTGLAFLSAIAAFDIVLACTQQRTIIDLVASNDIGSDQTIVALCIAAVLLPIVASLLIPIPQATISWLVSYILKTRWYQWLFTSPAWPAPRYDMGCVNEHEITNHIYETKDPIAQSVLQDHRSLRERREEDRHLLVRRSFMCAMLLLADWFIAPNSLLRSLVSYAEMTGWSWLLRPVAVGVICVVFAPWWSHLRHADVRQVMASRVYYPPLADKLRQQEEDRKSNY